MNQRPRTSIFFQYRNGYDIERADGLSSQSGEIPMSFSFLLISFLSIIQLIYEISNTVLSAFGMTELNVPYFVVKSTSRSLRSSSKTLRHHLSLLSLGLSLIMSDS